MVGVFLLSSHVNPIVYNAVSGELLLRYPFDDWFNHFWHGAYPPMKTLCWSSDQTKVLAGYKDLYYALLWDELGCR